MSIQLVAGGSGYFGCVLVRELLAQNKRVSVFDLNPFPQPDAVQFLKGDVRSQRDVANALTNVDTLFYAVAQVPLARQKHLFHSVNVEGLENVLSLSLSKGVKKIVYLSSSAIFGIPKQNPVTEETIPHPQEAYGRAKWEAEQIIKKYISKGLDVTIIRPRTILGDERLGIFSLLFSWVKEGRVVPVFDDGNNRYQFIHAKDLANACILASTQRGADIFNIGAENFSTMHETLDALIKYAGSQSRIKSFPMKPAVFAMRVTSALGLAPFAAYHSLMYGREFYFDVSKAKRKLLWQPRYSNKEMICESYDYFCRSIKSGKETSSSLHQKPVEEGILRWFNRKGSR